MTILGASDFVLLDGVSLKLSAASYGSGTLMEVLAPGQTALPGTTNRVAVSPDLANVYAVFGSTPFVTKVDASTGVRTNPGSPPPGGVGVAVSPDGSTVAVAHSTTPFVTRFNTSDMSKVTAFGTSPGQNGTAVAYNPAGNLLAVGMSASPFIALYDGTTKLSNPATLPPATVNDLDFSGNGTMLAVGCNSTSPRMRVYNTSTWASLTITTALPSFAVTRVKFSSDSAYLAVGTAAGTAADALRVYDTTTFTTVTLPSLSGVRVGQVRGLYWAGPRVLAVVMGDPVNIIWIDVVAGTIVKTVDVLRGAVNDAAGCPGGSFRKITGTVVDAVPASVSREIRFYDRERGTFEGSTVSTGGNYSWLQMNNRSTLAVAVGQSTELVQIKDKIIPDLA